MGKIVKVGLIQMHAGTNAQENLNKALDRIKKLAAQGAQIICLPELFLTEYFCQTEDKKFFEFAEKIPGGPTIKALSKAAKENNAVIVTSVYEKDKTGKLYNTAICIDADGKFVGKYRKMHIPDDLEHYYGETFYFEKGNLGVKVFKTKFATIGAAICWDQWFPEVARLAAAKGAEIVFYPTAIGFQLKDPLGINETERQAWQLIQRSHSIANNMFVVAVNHVGPENNLNFWGSSFVSDPYGRMIAEAPVNKEADIIAECDLGVIPQMRKDWPFLENRRIKLR